MLRTCYHYDTTSSSCDIGRRAEGRSRVYLMEPRCSTSVWRRLDPERQRMRMWSDIRTSRPGLSMAHQALGRTSSQLSAMHNGSRSGSIGNSAIYRSEEHTSELQSLMRISYAVFCLKKTTNNYITLKRTTKHAS